jgi:hypothetical protein
VDAVRFNSIFLYCGTRNKEDKAEMQKYALGYAFVMKLLKMGDYLYKGYQIFTVAGV